MKEGAVGKDLLILSILTVVAVTFWIILDVYHALNKSEVPKILEEQTKPINPKLDLSILEEIEKQVHYDWSEYQALPPASFQEAPEATPASFESTTIPTGLLLPKEGTDSGQANNQ